MGDGEAPVFADPAGYAAAGATLINCALVHSLDFDDTMRRRSCIPARR